MKIYKTIILLSIIFLFSFIAIEVSASTIVRSPNNTGLVGYWNFDVEAGGTNVVDVSGNGNDGTMTNMDPATDWVDGKIGSGALDFDGSNDYVSIGNVYNGVKTIAFWMKADDITDRKIINIDGTDLIEIDASGDIKATSFPSATVYVDGVAATAVTTGWHFITITDTSGINASTMDIGRIYPLFFEDTFTRVDSDTVGNSWSEIEGATTRARILSNRLDFNPVDVGNDPVVYHTFTKQTSGKIKWIYIFNFERTGSEGSYAVWMQLGDGLTAAPAGDTTGVAVNLRWGSDVPAEITDEEAFSYYDGSTFTQVAVVSGDAGSNAGGDATIEVIADLDANTFDLSITGAGLISGTGSATGVAFDNIVDIDTVMIYLDGVNQGKFGDLEIDDVIIDEDKSFDGLIDEVRIYNRALSANEIKRLYNLKTPIISKPALSDGLVGYWNFDVEAGGTNVVDMSGNGNDGTMIQMDPATDWVDGKIGSGALDFDGSDDEVAISNSAELFGMANLSLSAWIKYTGNPSVSAEKNIIDAWDTGDHSYLLRWDPQANKYDFHTSADTDTGGAFIPVIGADDNNWHLIVATYDGTTMRLYEDGIVSVTTVSQTGTIDVFVSDVLIGGQLSANASDFFVGLIDEVRIYNRALSANEIKRLYNLKMPIINRSQEDRLTNGLVGMWTFDGNHMDWSQSTAEARDQSGNANHGDVKNGATPVIGKIGQALSFDGDDDIVNVGSDSSLDNISTITVAAWIYPNSGGEGNWGRIIDKNIYKMFYLSEGDITEGDNTIDWYHQWTSGAGWKTDDDTITYGIWQHVAVTYDNTSEANDPLIYINGVSKTVNEIWTPSGSPASDASQNLTIGNRSATDRTFDGKMDDVRIYDRVLSANEITQLYNLGR